MLLMENFGWKSSLGLIYILISLADFPAKLLLYTSLSVNAQPMLAHFWYFLSRSKYFSIIFDHCKHLAHYSAHCHSAGRAGVFPEILLGALVALPGETGSSVG
jgi:hypothetical protein